MEYESKEVKKDEFIDVSGKGDVTENAVEIYQTALEFIEQHNGEIESMVLLMTPLNGAKDTRSLCSMLGPTISIANELLVAFDHLFQRIDPVHIALILDSFIDCIPVEKGREVMAVATKMRDKKIEVLMDEIKEHFKDE